AYDFGAGILEGVSCRNNHQPCSVGRLVRPDSADCEVSPAECLGALLTLVVVVPLIFRHYRRENLPLREKLQQLLFSGIVWITVGVAFGVDSYFSDQSVTGRGLLFRYGVALLWTIAGMNNLAKALRLRRSNDSASIS
ncbi:MAG TPA: hypothetical protein VFP40_00535, partial [Terriglobales bacterium]|nr:hypothetical protein [Terriglobales bacterium]